MCDIHFFFNVSMYYLLIKFKQNESLATFIHEFFIPNMYL